MSGLVPTGRRLGRIQGQLDDCALLLLAYAGAATDARDPVGTDLRGAAEALAEAVTSLNLAVSALNARAPRDR